MTATVYSDNEWLLDHIIVGDREYLSFVERGLL
jgi:DNA repair protein RadC